MSSTVINAAHVSRVRILYKTILRLHRGLPSEIKDFGDVYVKDEFKRHKSAEAQFVPIFMKEWTDYAVTLARQIGKKTSYEVLGVPLPTEKYSDLNDEQIGQLFELFQEIQKPKLEGTDSCNNEKSSSRSSETDRTLDSKSSV